MTDIDTSLITHVIFTDENRDTYEIKVTPKRMPWVRIAHQEVSDLIVSGAMPGASSVGAYRTQASARLRDGSVVDVTERLLRDGWSSWLEVDRFSPHHIENSTPERDARISAGGAADADYDAACAAEDAAMARAAASWRDAVAKPVVSEPAPATPAPVPANDIHDHATVLERAQSARDAADAEERRTLAAFLRAQEARRQAQADLDEILATAELYSAPAVSDTAGDWDPRLRPDAEDEAAEVRAHAEFVATLNELEADDRLTEATEATDAAEAELWSAVSRAEAVAGTEAVAEIGAACRVLWSAHRAERVASDVYDRANQEPARLAA